MRKGYVIIPVILYIILLSISVSAGVDDIDMQLLFNGNLDDETGNFTFVLLEGDEEYITDQKQEGTSSLWLDGDDCIVNTTGIVDVVANHTTSFWVYINSTVPDQAIGQIVGANQDTGGEYVISLVVSSGVYSLSWSVNNNPPLVAPFGADHLDTFFHVAFTYNGTHKIITFDGIENKTEVHASPTSSTGKPYAIGCKGTGQNNVNEIALDDFRIYMKEHLTPAEILTLTEALPTGATETPTIVFPSPVDNAINNTNVTFNVTHPSTLNDVTYYLYFGTSSTLTEDDLILNNTVRNASEWKSFRTNVSDGEYFYKWKVRNTTNNNFSGNTTIRAWSLDTTKPIIIIHPNNAFNSSDVSSINQYGDFMFINITITDETSLFGFMFNITRAGVLFFNYINVSLSENKTFNYSVNISITTWPEGVYDINVSASDAHTTAKIEDYDVSRLLGRITFDTTEGNEISISGGGAYSTDYTKRSDRYEFGFNYILTSTERRFTIRSKNKIYYLPDSSYAGHFVIIDKGLNGNWIDFEGIGNDYSVRKIDDFEYEITFINLPLSNKITAKSIGGVNVVTQLFKWYRGNFTTTSPNATAFGNTETFILNITRNTSHVNPNATLIYDGTEFTTTTTFDDDYVAFSRDLVITQPPSTSEKINFTWSVSIVQSDTSTYHFNISSTINVSESLLDNCSSYNKTVLAISGKDEETDAEVNITLDILFIPLSDSPGINNSYELTGSSNYTFCSNSDDNFTLDSIMEYGDGVTYTKRKYYLNSFSINPSEISEVTLYHLNNSKASEIVFTVFDTTTGDKVPGAFIKILRFYPGEDVLRIVEIDKTDELGETLGKMVLADVFYQFLIEKPAGTIKLDTGVLRILSLTRSFGITFAEDVLDTWNKIHGVSTSVTCTKGTQTCRMIWSDSSNIVQDATLEVWGTTGLTNNLLSTQTISAAAGTISYTIVEDTTGRAYTAKGFIESNTGTSLYGVGIASLLFSDNPFFTNESDRLASLFPLFLLVVVIIFALIDFGVVGIVIGALLGMIVGSMIGILPIDPFYLISFILMAIILIYKLSK